jgi:hypothetical protein
VKIPEVLIESGKSQKFRESQPMCLAYKAINLDDPDRADVIDVRCFWPNNSDTCRCVIWIRDAKGNRYSHGVGSAVMRRVSPRKRGDPGCFCQHGHYLP